MQVPVLEFNGKKLEESFEICKFLEKEFPEPSVFKTSCQTGMLREPDATCTVAAHSTTALRHLEAVQLSLTHGIAQC